MILSIIISVVACGLLISSVLFFPNIKIRKTTIPIYWLAPFVCAIILILSKNIDFNAVINGLTNSSSINPLKILALFISMTVLSVFLDEVGFFSFLASAVLKKANKSQKRLFISFYCITSILTIFTSNDIIILTFTPFICYFSKNAKINPIPYLISEFVSANTWSMMLIIGNPTNVYLASFNNIAFFEYVKFMALPTLFGGICSLALLFILFRKTLSKPLELRSQDIKLKNKALTIVGLTLLICCTILLAISNYIGLEMWYVCVGFALLLFIVVLIYDLIKKQKPSELLSTIKRAPWILVPFVLSMFVIVLALKENGVLESIANFLGKDNTIFKYGYSSFLSANLINNIPMSVLFSSIIESGIAPKLPAVYSAIIGSNIGAFLSPIGALAGIMWSNILSKHNIKFSFANFIKYGIIIGVPTITCSLLGLLIVV